jgi:hypothetical protein
MPTKALDAIDSVKMKGFVDRLDEINAKAFTFAKSLALPHHDTVT